MRKILFNNLTEHHKGFIEQFKLDLATALDTSDFIGGKLIKNFEDEFAKLCQVKHAISCANGTDALVVALRSMDIGLGDEVIVPAESWVSTASAVKWVGATPIFCDTQDDGLMDTNQIEQHINEKTKAIICVHLYGKCVEVHKIAMLVKKYNLFLIEDAAQAIGANPSHKPFCTYSDFATFSFYPGKNIGALGDAGALITNDRNLAVKSKMITQHGGLKRHQHDILGTNSRMDTLQAMFLMRKLKHVKNILHFRINIATAYDELIVHPNIIKPELLKDGTHVYHQYVIKIANRNEMQNYLKKHGIETSIHYPCALNRLPIFEKSNQFCQLAEKNVGEILSLPIYPEMQKEDVEYVAHHLNGFFK